MCKYLFSVQYITFSPTTVFIYFYIMEISKKSVSCCRCVCFLIDVRDNINILRTFWACYNIEEYLKIIFIVQIQKSRCYSLLKLHIEQDIKLGLAVFLVFKNTGIPHFGIYQLVLVQHIFSNCPCLVFIGKYRYNRSLIHTYFYIFTHMCKSMGAMYFPHVCNVFSTENTTTR